MDTKRSPAAHGECCFARWGQWIVLVIQGHPRLIRSSRDSQPSWTEAILATRQASRRLVLGQAASFALRVLLISTEAFKPSGRTGSCPAVTWQGGSVHGCGRSSVWETRCVVGQSKLRTRHDAADAANAANAATCAESLLRHVGCHACQTCMRSMTTPQMAVPRLAGASAAHLEGASTCLTATACGTEGRARCPPTTMGLAQRRTRVHARQLQAQAAPRVPRAQLPHARAQRTTKQAALPLLAPTPTASVAPQVSAKALLLPAPAPHVPAHQGWGQLPNRLPQGWEQHLRHGSWTGRWTSS